jgi:flagellar protein FliS
MAAPAHNQYLEQQVMTASPQKLQLMLIEATMRSAEKARAAWHEQDEAAACEAMVHAQSCVGELLAALNHNEGTELVRKLAGLYMFIFRRLVDANQQHDEKLLDEALNILGMERETWRQVCERCGTGEEEPSEQPAPRIGAPIAQTDTGIPGTELPIGGDVSTWIPGTGVPGAGMVDTGGSGLSFEA